jgi:hypothetical protein
MSIVAQSYGEGRQAMIRSAVEAILGKRKAAEAAYTPPVSSSGSGGSGGSGGGGKDLTSTMMGHAVKGMSKKAYQTGRRKGFEKIDRQRREDLDEMQQQFTGDDPLDAEDRAALAAKGMEFDEASGQVRYIPKKKEEGKKKETVAAAPPTPTATEPEIQFKTKPTDIQVEGT